MSTLPTDDATRGPLGVSTFGADLPAPPAAPSLVLVGAATGAATSLAVMFVYQLLRIGWQVSREATLRAGTASTTVDSPDRILGVLVMGGLLSLAPTVFAGGVLGAVLGWFLTVSRHRQGLIRSWLSGSILAYAAAVTLDVTVLSRHRAAPLAYSEWQRMVGIPSLLFVLIFGGLGVYLHLRQTRIGRTG